MKQKQVDNIISNVDSKNLFNSKGVKIMKKVSMDYNPFLDYDLLENNVIYEQTREPGCYQEDFYHETREWILKGKTPEEVLLNLKEEWELIKTSTNSHNRFNDEDIQSILNNYKFNKIYGEVGNNEYSKLAVFKTSKGDFVASFSFTE